MNTKGSIKLNILADRFPGPSLDKDKNEKGEAGEKKQVEKTETGEENVKDVVEEKYDKLVKGKEGKKDDKKEKKEPAREKVKINPKSLSLSGKPLGTLFPFLEGKEIGNLPIKNLEFTYCEEKEGHFFPSGLRLEVDVLLKDRLQWVGDGLKHMFGSEKRLPKMLHLSADLGKKRDWSKRPKIEDFILRGNFKDFGNETWDVLRFKTLGLELTATKAASKGSDEKKSAKKKDPSHDADETEKTSEAPLKAFDETTVTESASKSQPSNDPDDNEKDASESPSKNSEKKSKEEKEKEGKDKEEKKSKVCLLPTPYSVQGTK